MKADTRKEAEKAARDFEGIFLRQIIRDMRKSAEVMDDGGLFGKGEGSGIKEDWFDSMFSEHMWNTGQVGLADALVKDWTRSGRLGDAEKATLEAKKTLANKHEYNLHNNRLLEIQVQDRVLKNIP